MSLSPSLYLYLPTSSTPYLDNDVRIDSEDGNEGGATVTEQHVYRIQYLTVMRIILYDMIYSITYANIIL